MKMTVSAAAALARSHCPRLSGTWPNQFAKYSTCTVARSMGMVSATAMRIHLFPSTPTSRMLCVRLRKLNECTSIISTIVAKRMVLAESMFCTGLVSMNTPKPTTAMNAAMLPTRKRFLVLSSCCLGSLGGRFMIPLVAGSSPSAIAGISCPMTLRKSICRASSGR